MKLTFTVTKAEVSIEGDDIPETVGSVFAKLDELLPTKTKTRKTDKTPPAEAFPAPTPQAPPAAAPSAAAPPAAAPPAAAPPAAAPPATAPPAAAPPAAAPPAQVVPTTVTHIVASWVTDPTASAEEQARRRQLTMTTCTEFGAQMVDQIPAEKHAEFLQTLGIGG